jgi:hypothetical protein
MHAAKAKEANEAVTTVELELQKVTNAAKQAEDRAAACARKAEAQTAGTCAPPLSCGM